MYNNPNEQQPPYGQTPYTSSYEQQYGQAQPYDPYGQQVPPSAPTQYGAPPYVQPLYTPVPPPQKSNKTLWIVLGVLGGVLVLIVGLCSFALYSVNQAAHHFQSSIGNIDATVNAQATADQGTVIADEEPPQQQAENFYLAISVQDYSGAYNYLSSNATLNGSAITQSDFTQQAQQMDSSEGDVTDYTATADPNDSTKVTVQVTRANGKVYSAHMTFVQGSFQWEISSLDTI